ncbi:cysteine proteinase [Lentithecium fluviatile CBS 122367]|uniref:ubiquitinyl hydrolase 1 n=1 Tax=Lentithecium fluviatile CBS 122367 TaxID=1168545 RepID=A0A6G1J713_9PLEO|nr:cysteine proteinase [Lentithecium fluviatile CBS 122367]
MHDEVFEATLESSAASRDSRSPTAASSPSEAYANMTLDRDPTPDVDRTRAAEHRPHPRASSPAKRPHSDIVDDSKMDVDGPPSARRGSGQSSPRSAKPLPAASTRSLRATSVEMVDAASNGGSAASSDSNPASNTESSATSVSTTPSANVPSLEEQVDKVLAISRKPLQDGQVGYVVSQKWLERVWARTPQYAGKQREFSKSATEGEIGPVDNSDLVDTATLSEDLADQHGDDFIPLRPGLMYEHNFEVLPAEAWELIISWYGVKDNHPVIRRYVHNTSPNQWAENLQYEMYPPIFTIRRVRKIAPMTLEPAKKLVASQSDNFVEFIKTAKQLAGIDLNNKVRIWRILNVATALDQAPQRTSGMLTPEASPPPAAPLPLAMDANSLANLEIGTQREEVTGKDEKANETFNEELNLSAAGLAEDQVLVLEEHDETGEYITDALAKVASKTGTLGAKSGNKANRGLQSAANSGRSTPAPAGPMTRGRTRSGRTRGTVGLTNLGNTCYMNSALQCIRSVEELAIYFLHEEYKKEINVDNPLGHNGSIARAYAGLLNSIYGEDVNTTSFAPRNFKNALGRAQPIFSGYGQQDSQEFLSFLVDGLHEDLNRIQKKPYTEYPESDDKTVHDPEAIKALGNKFRAIHRSRNDSVAMDLFNGFYKNTMVCPDCDKVSITFDPYSLLTLQLPIEQTWQQTVRFVPLHGNVWNVEVDIDKNATIKALKDYVGKRFNVKSSHIMSSELYSHKFYRHLDDEQTVAESNLQPNDDYCFYELEDVPSNWPPPKNKKKKYTYTMWSASHDSEDDIPDVAHARHDQIVVPIFHRGPPSSAYRANGLSMQLWPSYIVVNREEARDYDTILKKVLAKVAQMTTRDIFGESSDGSLAQSHSGSDVVLTTEEDASPNGDPRVQDGSVEGEDNMVEVTMTEPTETPQAPSADGDDVPTFLRPDGLIPAELRQLFEMKHTRAVKEYVTTGWNAVDANKSYEPISKRIRVPSTRASSVESLDAASGASSSDEDDVPQFSADAQSSIEEAAQSSDEDLQPSIEPAPFNRGGRKKNKSKKARKQERKHKNNKNFKMNGKKGKDRFPEQPSQSFSDPESEDDDRLVRMGEAIVLDWVPEAYDALFGGLNPDDPRGMDALRFAETLEDKELEARKARRANRKANGVTLEECFAETSKSEVLSEDNAWYCNRCKELRRAKKTLEIWTTPDILVVHLKRFSSHRAFRDKVDELVDFPVEGLDLTGKVGLPEDKELVYDLFAVDNHYGGLGGGHYTAYAKNFFDQEWYEYNVCTKGAIPIAL